MVCSRRATGSTRRGGHGLAYIHQPGRGRVLAIKRLPQSLLKQFAAFVALVGNGSVLRVLLSSTFMVVLWSTWARQVGLLLAQ